MDRYLREQIAKDLDSKIIIVMGPRQCGKTTMAKSLSNDIEYLNLDYADDILKVDKMSWDKRKSILLLDEFHKYTDWKRYLKGIYDKYGLSQKIVVTGSAKLDTYRKVGDSLAGRYFQFRLFPFDLAEVVATHSANVEQAFEVMTQCGGFPEPYLQASREYYQRWRRTHFDIILRQDLVDEKSVSDIKSIEVLKQMLVDRVGGGVSYNNLAMDLQRDHNTIKRWCELLENMYVFFKVSPYSNNIARSLLKEPKYYCFDVGAIGDRAAQLENIVALALLKRLYYLEDVEGKSTALHYCRTKDGQELDFYVEVDDSKYLIEVKTSDDSVSKSFNFFRKFFPNARGIQLVFNLKDEQFFDWVEVRDLRKWLAAINTEIL